MCAFVIPVSFYSITKYLQKDRVYLPKYFVIDRIDSVSREGVMGYDTIYHQVAEMVLTNQLGEQVGINKDLRGKIVLVNLFFANCPTVCPELTNNIAILQKAFRKTAMKANDTIAQFVSITVNPERDSFPALREYAQRYKVNHDHWWMLTGNKQDIYNYARNELRLNLSPGDGGAEDFIHSEMLVLLDKDRNIRGYYNGLDKQDLKRCADDIGWLSLEKKHSKK